ncbi:hypothetical protein HK097_010154 [Rhizophlyctis rosea]|uniref:HMG box domain-containing protein n=1 Tax=Rhizophlyctis rosea TaxID=64517 RepID=A0AAD5SPE0_9FUNG|nr:hypothetical protein HK097_010154 [Rhizophlyctis rosea]
MPKAATEKKAPAKKTTGGATKRGTSAYNVFMKNELPKVKAANPGIAHKEAFKKAAGNWKNSPENPVK